MESVKATQQCKTFFGKWFRFSASSVSKKNSVRKLRPVSLSKASLAGWVSLWLFFSLFMQVQAASLPSPFGPCEGGGCPSAYFGSGNSCSTFFGSDEAVSVFVSGDFTVLDLIADDQS